MAILGLCLAALASAGALIAAPAASAAPVAVQAYSYSHSFGTEGQMAPPTWSGGLRKSHAIGIDPPTGDVLVAEEGNARIAVYDPASGPADPPISTFGEGEAWAEVVVMSNGDLYAASTGTLARFNRNPGNPPTYTRVTSYAPATGSLFAVGLAVDPTTQDLLVVNDGNSEVVRYDPSGNRLSGFRVRGEFSAPNTAGVTSNGTIFVHDSSGSFVSTLSRFTASGEALSRKVLSRGNGDETPNITYDPIHDGVDVVEPVPGAANLVEGYAADGRLLYSFSYPDFTAGADAEGIAVDPNSGRFYSVTSGSTTGVQVYEPAVYPGAEDPVVSAITTSGAHLTAEVDPGEEAGAPPVGSYARFEYSADGGKSWVATPDQDDSTATVVEATVTGLDPNLPYLVRAVAGNAKAKHTTEATSFVTLPVAPIVITSPPTGVTESSAVLNATVNPAGLQTTYYFEYGTTTDYGSRVPGEIDADAGIGRVPRSFDRTLTGLASGTTYHYRIVASNSVGTTRGEDQSFTTLGAGAALLRAFEQVTPVDKNGGSIDSGIGFLASGSGSQLAYIVRSPGNAFGSPLLTYSYSRRGGSDWEGAFPVDPPLNVVRSTVFETTIGISPDFSHAFVISNKVLAPGAIEDGANLYVVDLATHAYTLVAASSKLGTFDSFSGIEQQNKLVSGNADYSSIVFGSVTPLLPNVTGTQLYRWSRSGGLQLESTLPGGAAPTAAAQLPPLNGYLRVTSDDLSRNYFVLFGGNPGEAGVYLNEGGQVRAISVSHRLGDDPTLAQPGEILGVSRDGRYAFFESDTAQLTEDAAPQQGDIYRYDAVTDQLEYLGAQTAPIFPALPLAVSDSGDTLYFSSANGVETWRNGQLALVAEPSQVGSVGPGSTFVTPDGRFAAIAGNENRSVYLYDADSGTKAKCVSCFSDGTDPRVGRLPDSEHFINNTIPQPLDAEGDLFFDTTARLLPADGNGTSDVYEYRKGQLQLISPGNQPFAARIGTVSNDGRDVYFATGQKLVGRDDDKAIDIYDARLGGGLPVQSPPEAQECLRDDCKATPNAGPELPFGGSESLSGPQNVKPKKGKAAHSCPKGKQRKAGKCVKKGAKKHHAKKHAKKAKTNRRQGR